VAPIADRTDRLVAAWERELPEVVGPYTELAKRLVELAGQISVVIKETAADHGLTVAEYDVLCGLRRQGEPFRLTPTQLRHELLLSSGGTSNVLRQLTDRGLVQRGVSESDLRSRWVQLTPTGAALADTTVLASSEAQTRLLRDVTDDQATRAAAQLRSIAAAIG
jgi:DNA-binding MarR family transcriptional regulator